PASMQRWSRRWQAGEKNKERLKDILEEISRRSDWPGGSVEQIVGDDYASCMDEARAEASGIAPLAPMLAEIDGIRSQADLQRAIGHLQTALVFAPFALGAQPDQHDPTGTTADIGAAGRGLPDRDYYLKPEPRFADAREKYRLHVQRMFELAGAAGAKEAADVVFAFEKRLAEASLDNVALRDPNNLDHPTSFEKLRALTPHFDWSALYDEAKLPQGELNVEQPAFLAQFEKELAQTPLPAWRTYLRWQLLASAAPWLSTFRPEIGYPDKWKDYSGVRIRRDAPVWENVLEGRKFVVDDFRSTIGKPTDRGRWGMTPPTSDAYYNPLLNEIVFPAGILQPPAFDLEATDAVNYGAIGVVIGHEISHGFHDQGAQFDASGRLHNWWTAADLESFRQRGQCVVNQFEGFYIEPAIHHNGRLVLGESIGDLAGARIAFAAFQKALGQHPQPVRDGFTPEQQFFIAW